MKRFENQGAGDPSDQDVETMIPQSSEREPQSILRRRKPGNVLLIKSFFWCLQKGNLLSLGKNYLPLILIFSGERDAEKRVRFDDSVKKSEDGMNFTQNYTNEF